MKFFSLPALLAAALISVAAALPFLPAAKKLSDLFQLEVRLSATGSGTLQAYYDDGSGFREERSARERVTADPAPTTYRLPLPTGNYRMLRLDPPDHGVTTVLYSLRVVTKSGLLNAELPLGGFQPAQQIDSFTFRDGSLEIKTSPQSDDPQLHYILPRPLVVQTTLVGNVLNALPVVLPVFGVLALLLLAADRAPRLQARLGARLHALALRPGRLVSLVAAVAVIASTYPIVFLGKSFVSPNFGTILLYDQYPTLPGYKDATVGANNGADVGAMMYSHLPLSVVQSRALGRDHELPLWNRYNSGGTPLLGQGQSMFGDPLHCIVLAANSAAWSWDLKYLLAKWLFAAGLGLIVLNLTRHLPAALLVTLAAPFFGFFIYRLNHPAFFSVCYAPWPLYCWLRLASADGRRARAVWAGGLLTANFALMNSGTAKEAYMLLLTMNFSGVSVVLTSAAPWRERLTRLAVAAWAGVIFILLAAPIWGTFLDTLKQAYTSYNAVSAFQIQPSLLLGAFDEAFYRPLMPSHWAFNPSANFLLLLGLLYFLATLRTHFTHHAAITLAVTALLPLTLAFGLVPPAWIVRVPFLANVAHLDNTFTCALLVLWSALAGVGFAQAFSRLGSPEGRGDLIVAGLMLFGLVFGWIGFGHASHRPIYGPTFSVYPPGQSLHIRPFVWCYLAALLIAAVTFALAARRALRLGRLSPTLGLLLAGAALAMCWRMGLHSTAIGFEPFTTRPPVRVNLHAKSSAIEFTRAAVQREPARGFGLHGNYFPGWNAFYGLESVHGPDALVNPWMRDLTDAAGIERMWDWRLYADASNVATVRPFLDALNVRYYFDLHSDQAALGKSLTMLKGADLDVYESKTAWPRAFFTDRVATYEHTNELVALFKTANGRPLAAAQRPDVTASPALARITGELAGRSVAPATDYRLTNNTTSFTVRASGPGAIVLNEVLWARDFRAEVNGQRVPIVRLNHAFKGVLVDAAGEYRVTFRYWPRNLTRNLILCGVGALLLAGSIVFALRPARNP